MMRLFASPWGALTGWVHYLAFDTLVARWMMNRAPDAGYRLAPILFATMMFGPIGFLAFRIARPLLTRSSRSLRPEHLSPPHGVDGERWAAAPGWANTPPTGVNAAPVRIVAP